MQAPATSPRRLWTFVALLVLLIPASSAVVAVQEPVEGGHDPPAPTANQPYVTSTDPADGTAGVALWAWVTITFSRPMNASNTIFPTDPAVAFLPSWYNLNSTLILRHAADFAPCTTYRMFVDGADLEGQGVLMGPSTPGPPNPWTFTTVCGTFAITRTDPADGQRGVVVNGEYQRITVWFSRAADPTTLQVILTPAVPLSPTWSNGNTKVILGHGDWFYDCLWTSVTVSARDAGGSPLANVTGLPPNPWRFETACISPVIVRTNPANDTTDVPLHAPILVTFNKAMDIATVSWSVLPEGLSFGPDWSTDMRTVTLAHPSPFPLQTTFTVTIAGRDAKGADLAPGPVPNPWSFTTSSTVVAPGGLQVTRAPPDIRLTWRPVPGATSYAVYASQNRFAAWPWPKLAEVPGTSYVHGGADSDPMPHYYVVRAAAPTGGEGPNSTMGVKVTLAFAFSPFRSNVHWLSLPYRSTYRSARNLSDALTEARIDVVAKWDPVTQSSVLWYFLRGAWRGTDFTIAPGEGFYIGVVSSFFWVITGTDGAVPRTFTAPLSSDPSSEWVGLPYTATYAWASDVVRSIEGDVGPDAPARIIEISAWDPIAERLLTFHWTPIGWGGEDFAIGPSSSLCFRVISEFTWAPALIVPEVP